MSESQIWERILETGDIKELENLLRLVIDDEESIRVIVNKLADFEVDNTSKCINITIRINKKIIDD